MPEIFKDLHSSLNVLAKEISSPKGETYAIKTKRGNVVADFRFNTDPTYIAQLVGIDEVDNPLKNSHEILEIKLTENSANVKLPANTNGGDVVVLGADGNVYNLQRIVLFISGDGQTFVYRGIGCFTSTVTAESVKNSEDTFAHIFKMLEEHGGNKNAFPGYREVYARLQAEADIQKKIQIMSEYQVREAIDIWGVSIDNVPQLDFVPTGGHTLRPLDGLMQERLKDIFQKVQTGEYEVIPSSLDLFYF